VKFPRPLFRKYFLILTLISGLMLVLTIIVSMVIDQAEHRHMPMASPKFFTHLLQSTQSDKIAFVRDLNLNSPDRFPMRFELVNKNGRSELDGRPVWTAAEISSIHFPSDPEQVESLFPNSREPPSALARLYGSEDLFLLMTPDKNRRPPPPPIAKLILLLFAAITMASGISLLIIFRSFRKRAENAENIIKSLQLGDLKARFPVNRVDEVTHLMISFNKMADEIERLVSQLKNRDEARVKLLQELAHDLRTPIASLKNLNAAVHGTLLDQAKRTEFNDLSRMEIDYVAALVDDLLFLGQVLEPRYKGNSQAVDILDIIDDQLELMKNQYPNIKTKIIFPEKNSLEPQIIGEHQQLTRLVRNALANAFSFANGEIQVSLSSVGKRNLCLCISDDGPGLSDEQIKSFGKRRPTRSLENTAKGRLSFGLGSVIMTAITEAHGGLISIANFKVDRGGIGGAQLRIELPFIENELG